MDIQHKLYNFSYNQETGISIMLVGEKPWTIGMSWDMNVIFLSQHALTAIIYLLHMAGWWDDSSDVWA